MTFEETAKYLKIRKSKFYKIKEENKSPAVKIEFKENNKVIISVPYNQELIRKIKTISGRRWNPNEKYWKVPYDENLISSLLVFFGENISIDPHFYLIPLQKELSIRKYSRRTIKSYIRYNRDFLLFANNNPEEIENEDIKKYLYYMVEKKNISASTLNIIINALRFYYGEILKRKFIYEIKRPRKDRKLPVVLSREEIAKILSSVDNIKHKTILMLAYSAGLRVSEVIRLKPEDIDSKRKLIHIKGSKGRKDRYTLLSETVLKTLREYWNKYRPQKWLFEGAKEEKHLSARTADKIFKNAFDKAGITKKVSFHSPSHSFATHLLEGGTDLRYIQELLGHAHSKTTEVYTHVRRKNLGKIVSPIDTINLNRREER